MTALITSATDFVGDYTPLPDDANPFYLPADLPQEFHTCPKCGHATVVLGDGRTGEWEVKCWGCEHQVAVWKSGMARWECDG